MSVFDHAYFLIVAAVLPVAGFVSFRRLMRRVAAGELVRPMHLYRVTVLVQWVLFAVLAIAWFASERSFAALGFTLEPDARFLVGLALTIIAIALLWRQLARLDAACGDDLDAFERQLGDLRVIFPRTRSDLAGFYGMSVTAGIVEETIWRGFLFWYLGQVMPLWAAAVLSAIGFGLAHAYQGIAAVPRITLVGAVFAALYLLTGSLWLSMLLHAAVDALQGRAIFGALQKQRASA